MNATKLVELAMTNGERIKKECEEHRLANDVNIQLRKNMHAYVNYSISKNPSFFKFPWEITLWAPNVEGIWCYNTADYLPFLIEELRSLSTNKYELFVEEVIKPNCSCGVYGSCSATTSIEHCGGFLVGYKKN